MLVALGSALFTVLSIHGFVTDGAATGAIDPTRIAAQIVSGIGFLGAGAILKDGVVIRGLTTAASLWATSAVGMAAGAGEYVVGIVGAAIILTSLWPINALAERFHGTAVPEVQVRLELRRVEAIGEVSSTLAENKIDIASLQTQRLGRDSYRADLSIRGRSNAAIAAALEDLARIEGVDIITTSTVD
jgi:putative Mg2+ transporter-C (MgtC) family protein